MFYKLSIRKHFRGASRFKHIISDYLVLM